MDFSTYFGTTPSTHDGVQQHQKKLVLKNLPPALSLLFALWHRTKPSRKVVQKTSITGDHNFLQCLLHGTAAAVLSLSLSNIILVSLDVHWRRCCGWFRCICTSIYSYGWCGVAWGGCAVVRKQRVVKTTLYCHIAAAARALRWGAPVVPRTPTTFVLCTLALCPYSPFTSIVNEAHLNITQFLFGVSYLDYGISEW
jgi:hypothetical protein